MQLGFNPSAVEKQLPVVQQQKMRETAQAFESFFVYQMLELMAPEPSEDPVFGGGFAEGTLRHQYAEQNANAIAQRGGIGLADAIYTQLLRAQEQTLNLNQGE